MFILNPDSYLLPSYRISPFQTADISRNNTFPDSDAIDTYFINRFGHTNYIYTNTGRDAINRALQHYNLKKEDTVSIVTTSNNFYISGCVTSEIEKFCKWDRQISSKTKVIFVNHEFGYSYQELKKLKAYGLPIIEDCAHSFYSEGMDKRIGKIGDFVIYSFPKMFPVQIGGLLVSNIDKPLITDMDANRLRYMKNVLSHEIYLKDQVVEKRMHNYHTLKSYLSEFGFNPRFSLDKGTVPGVYLFNVNDKDLDLDKMKSWLWKHGIQCSVFYGENTFFIPVHQRLENKDLLYFKEVIRAFLRDYKR